MASCAHFFAIVPNSQTSLPVLCLLIQLVAIACFIYVLARRMVPLLRAEHDYRFDRPGARFERILKFWLAQWKQPRYPFAGVIHIAIFAGFVLLMFRSGSLVMMGFTGQFSAPEITGDSLYKPVKDYAATLVFVSVLVAAIRRIAFKPPRYAVPPQFGRDHTWEATTSTAECMVLKVGRRR